MKLATRAYIPFFPGRRAFVAVKSLPVDWVDRSGKNGWSWLDTGAEVKAGMGVTGIPVCPI